MHRFLRKKLLKKDFLAINLKEPEVRNAICFFENQWHSFIVKSRIRQFIIPNSHSKFKIVNEVGRKGHFLKRTIISANAR